MAYGAIAGSVDPQSSLWPSKQTKPLLSPLSALTSAQRWDDWGLCFSESIIITQSIKMSCLLICIKIYCASDISRLRKIYISQHTSSILFPLFQKKGYWNKRFDYIFGTTRRCLQQKSTQEGGLEGRIRPPTIKTKMHYLGMT